MHGYILLGNNRTLIEKKIKELGERVLEFQIKGIEQVRELRKSLSLKFNQKTVVFIQNIDEATLEAQNALLKILEEPQENLIMVASARQRGLVLPTVLSRLQMINLHEDIALDKERENTIFQFINMDAAGRIQQIAGVRNRKEAESFLEDCIKYGHHLLLQELDIADWLAEVIDVYLAIKNNGNVQLQMLRLCMV